MVIRIVRMYFEPGTTSQFQEIFENSKSTILASPGCTHLELWQDLHDESVFITHSHWESEAALNRYRSTPFFKSVWQETKKLFRDKPFVFSVKKV
jgi:quinol monooxygenase YgiN